MATEVRTYFVREKNALVARADFSDLYAGLILHEADHGLRHPPRLEQNLRDALGALTLHCASRPRAETCAWTIHTPNPPINYFVTGSNPSGLVTGTLFTKDVKEIDGGVFYCQTTTDSEEPRLSVTDFEGESLFGAAETFYTQSEQRPARIFRHSEEDLVMISAQPDCDLVWLENLDQQDILTLDQTCELALLETRNYDFGCGCSREHIEKLIGPALASSQEDQPAENSPLRVRCPRCGARYEIVPQK